MGKSMQYPRIRGKEKQGKCSKQMECISFLDLLIYIPTSLHMEVPLESMRTSYYLLVQPVQ